MAIVTVKTGTIFVDGICHKMLWLIGTLHSRMHRKCSNLSCLHPYILTSSHPQTITSSHHHIITSSHPHILTPSHPHTGADQEHKTDEMHTALMEASMDGHVDVARLLLDHGAQASIEYWVHVHAQNHLALHTIVYVITRVSCHNYILGIRMRRISGNMQVDIRVSSGEDGQAVVWRVSGSELSVVRL